eukprot:3007791-Karenia_brevis.AAC.1
MYAETPTEVTTQLYISPDKSPKQRRTEIASKRLLKSAGTVAFRWVDVARVVVPRRDADPELLFKQLAMEKFDMDKETVKESFKNFVASRNGGDDMRCS